jgi:hypothetical protein
MLKDLTSKKCVFLDVGAGAFLLTWLFRKTSGLYKRCCSPLILFSKNNKLSTFDR